MIKRFKKIVFIMPVLLGILWMHGCIHDDFDDPPQTDVPTGDVMTLSELRDMFDGSPVMFNDHASVYAIVTMDDKSGNIYRSAFVEDGTAAINLRLQAPGGIYQGDSVRINLKGTTLGSYQGMLQLDDVNVDQNIIKQGTGKSTEPLPVQLGQIGPEHQARLIRLEGVQFRAGDVGQPFADSENLLAMDRILEDCDGETVTVRTSGYANFADHPVPEGNGSLLAVVSQYRDNMQLYIRHIDEVKLDGERCDDQNDIGDVDPVTSIDEDFQGYSNFDEIDQHGWNTIAEEGGRKWICRMFDGNHYAQATAFNSPDPNNIMWLVTPPVDLDAMVNPVFEFQTAHEHLGHDAVHLYLSTDFDGSNPSEATWEELDARLVDQNDPFHTWIDSGVIDLDDYSGIVYIAWRYEGSHPDGTNGSVRVNNVKLYEND